MGEPPFNIDSTIKNGGSTSTKYDGMKNWWLTTPCSSKYIGKDFLRKQSDRMRNSIRLAPVEGGAAARQTTGPVLCSPSGVIPSEL